MTQQVKASACNAGDTGSIPGLGRPLREGNGNPHQYSCLEKNPKDRGAWLQSMEPIHKHRLHNHRSQFLKINLFLSVFLSFPPLLLCLPPSLYICVCV